MGASLSDKNRFSIVMKHLCGEWDYEKNDITPSEITYASNKSFWWKCSICGKEWVAKASSRSRSGKLGCNTCRRSHLNLVKKDKRFDLLYPELLKEWDEGLNEHDPSEVSIGSRYKAHWICNKGHKWKTRVYQRVKGNKCPYCTGKKVCLDNCLATTQPHIAKEWHPSKNVNLTPYDFTDGSGEKVWWKCKKGHEWKAVISCRKKGNACPFCYKVELKDGTICDSIAEAFVYLAYVSEGKKFLHNRRYGDGIGKKRYDFYLVDENKYVEVTRFGNKSDGLIGVGGYFRYLRGIVEKKIFVKNVLGAKFEFIQLNMSFEDQNYVRTHCK